MPRGRPRKHPLPTEPTLPESKLNALRDAPNPNQMEIPETKKEEPQVLPQPMTYQPQSTPIIQTIDPKAASILTGMTSEAKLSASSLTITEAPPVEVATIVIQDTDLKGKNNVPPIKRTRNEYGLLDNIDYIFKEDGKIDWRKMIPSEFLVFNREKKSEIESKYGKKLDELSVTEVEDKYLLILLFGIRYIASLRGFTSVKPRVDFCSDYKAVVTTTINWIGNNDTEMRQEIFGDVASTSPSNTNGFGQMFLESVATNRSFVRAVRNYLEINIVGQDEVKPNEKENGKSDTSTNSDPTSIHKILKESAEALGITFEQFREVVKTKYASEVESDYTKWGSYNDPSPGDAYKLSGILKKRLQEKKLGK